MQLHNRAWCDGKVKMFRKRRVYQVHRAQRCINVVVHFVAKVTNTVATVTVTAGLAMRACMRCNARTLARLFAATLLLAASATFAAPRAERVVDVRGIVWGFDFLSADELLLTVRRGALVYANLSDGEQRTIKHTLDIAADGQGGLLDIALEHRADQSANPIDVVDVYLTYSTRVDGKLTTALARGEWRNGQLVNLRRIFIAATEGDGGRHFGSRILLDGDALYLTIGDRGARDFAQDLMHHNGKILRLTRDGAPAPGNPFAERDDARAEIWSYGHRNPQGIDSDASGAVYSAEFGPRGGDELNRIAPGNNYGWPLISDGYEYWGPKFNTHHPGMLRPIVFWTPSISPSGIAFYRGDKTPEWRNHLFIACLSGAQLRRLELTDGVVVAQQALFTELHQRIRQVRNGRDGYLYFSTDSGGVYRVMN